MPPGLGGRPWWDGIASAELEATARMFPATHDTIVPEPRVLFRQIGIFVDAAKEQLNAE